ncbi:MAG TPA: hypothetical protein VF484_01920, partial [Candidatus Limnocylindrales bacterium]
LTTPQLVAAWKAVAGLPVRGIRGRRRGWRPGRMGKGNVSPRPADRDSRPSTSDAVDAMLEA